MRRSTWRGIWRWRQILRSVRFGSRAWWLLLGVGLVFAVALGLALRGMREPHERAATDPVTKPVKARKK